MSAVSPAPFLLLEGTALHAGRPASLSLRRLAPGSPLTLSAEGVTAPVDELVVVRCDHGVAVRLGSDPDAPVVDLVEHLFAALGGLNVRDGVAIEVAGGEVPLLDGGALAISLALRSMGARSFARRLRVLQPFAATIDGSRYSLRPSVEPAIHVSIRFAHADIGEQVASYRFDEASFLEQIAPARTFGFFAEWSTLLASGRARGVDPRSVVIFDEPGKPRSRPVTRDEPVRHKLLDLMGDCALFGGPFEGVLEASAPGHARTHAFLARAIDTGALERWA